MKIAVIKKIKDGRRRIFIHSNRLSPDAKGEMIQPISDTIAYKTKRIKILSFGKNRESFCFSRKKENTHSDRRYIESATKRIWMFASMVEFVCRIGIIKIGSHISS
jgi:hypothetical protein